MSSINDIPNGWFESTIGELVDLAQGVAINAKTNYVLSDKENGVPLLKINNLLNNTIDQYVDLKLVPKKTILEKDDVIFTRTGQVGWVFTNKFGVLHNNSFKVIPNDRLNKKFLYWFLKQKSIFNYVQKVASGSAQPDLNHGAFKTIEIRFPSSLEEQKAIANILSAFDSKIENLQAQNKTLEQTAQTIFKEWFGKYQVGDELPGGWRFMEFDEVSILSAGGDKPKAFSEVKNKPYSIPIYSNGIKKNGLYGYTDKPKIKEESVTISARGTIGFVCLRSEPYVPIVRLVVAIPKQEFISNKYLYLYLKNMKITGTGTTQQQLTVPAFRKEKILVPNAQKMEEFTLFCNSVFEKIKINFSQIQTLKKTRDTLLPKLMSGQLRVNEFKD